MAALLFVAFEFPPFSHQILYSQRIHHHCTSSRLQGRQHARHQHRIGHCRTTARHLLLLLLLLRVGNVTVIVIVVESTFESAVSAH